MKKTLIITLIALLIIGVAIALLGMYKFNHLANQPGYNVDGNKIKDYIGLSVEEAQKLAQSNGVPFRVVMKDDQPLPATMDWRPGRINAEVKSDIVTGYQIEGQETEEEVQTFDQNSWKEIIADDCQSFSDGCNNCRREAGSDVAACTRKACQNYEKPKCLDTEE